MVDSQWQPAWPAMIFAEDGSGSVLRTAAFDDVQRSSLEDLFFDVGISTQTLVFHTPKMRIARID